MSFTINIGHQRGVDIILVVVRDCINLNFVPCAGTDANMGLKVRSSFNCLFDGFLRKKAWLIVRGRDAEHVKRHHAHHDELNIVHSHYSYSVEVYPKILAEFLLTILKGQYICRKMSKYQFISVYEAEEALNNFTKYYREFKGSATEKLDLEGRRLTTAEKTSLLHSAKEENATLKPSEKREIEAYGVFAEKLESEFLSRPQTNNLSLTPGAPTPLFFDKKSNFFAHSDDVWVETRYRAEMGFGLGL